MSIDHLTRLHDLASFVLAEENLDTRLRELAGHAARAVGGATCSIMLLSEGDASAPRLKLWASTETLPRSAWAERPGLGEAIVGRVLQDGRELVVEDVQQSEFAALARRRGNVGSSFMCVPVAIGSRMIGVMNFANTIGAPPFAKSELMLASIAATLVGKSVQVERLQTLLRSRVAQATLAKEEKQLARSLTNGSVPPAQIAKMLAKSFYRDLAAAGFEAGQIIAAASEMISLVSTNIGRHKKRMARQKK